MAAESDKTAEAVADASEATTADSIVDGTQSPVEPKHHGRLSRWLHHYRSRLSFTGMVLAAIMAALSLTPSLLPRGALFQGIVTGGSAAFGYLIGVFLCWLVRFMIGRTEPWPRRPRSWWIALGVLSLMAIIAMTINFANWQMQMRELIGVPPLGGEQYPLMFIFAYVFFLLFMFIGQAWGALVRGFSRWLGRWVPNRVSAVISLALVLALTIGLLNGVVARKVADAVRSTFESINSEYNPSEAPTQSPYKSGGPNSGVNWKDLGAYGRNFVAYAPTVQQLTEFNGAPAMEPVRAYAGLYSGEDLEADAEIAADELVRLGGLQRKVVGIATSTGRGWVNEVTMSTLDYMYNGDTAMVSMQYSTLPSFIGFLFDHERARRAGLALFEAVDRRINDLAPEVRPKLVVMGESLGTFGGEAAFGSIGSMLARTDGALFSGPTFGNTIWGDLTANRDPGSPMWRPVYQEGKHVRFGAEAPDFRAPTDKPWDETRVVYVQHPTDPVTWFSPKLLFSKPDWLKGERGPDVLPQMHWYPVVTFLQVAADLAVAGDQPDGHGHTYLRAIPYAWASILQPPGWTDEKSAHLGTILETHTDG